MRSDIMWKVGLIVAVLALSVYSLYPPKDRIKLGLDLKGGVHLVIQVQTDDALKVQGDQEIARLDDRLRGDAVTVKSIQPGAPGQIGPSHSSHKKRIAGKDHPVPKNTDGPRRVTGGMEDLQRQASDLDHISVLHRLVGDRGGAPAEHGQHGAGNPG